MMKTSILRGFLSDCLKIFEKNVKKCYIINKFSFRGVLCIIKKKER